MADLALVFALVCPISFDGATLWWALCARADAVVVVAAVAAPNVALAVVAVMTIATAAWRP